MDPHDEPPDRPVRPPPPRVPYVALQERAGQLRQTLSEVPSRVRRHDASRSTSFVPASDTVVIDERRHPFLLVWPVLRTLLGLACVIGGLPLFALLAFALVTGGWARVRFGTGARRTTVVAAVATLALVVLTGLSGALLGALLLLMWAAEDVADWWCDRLVVTNRRIYRRHGVLTRHSPSIALTAIAFLDAAVPPLGRLMQYGTLRLDSVAQRDAPLARFDLVPDVVPVSHEILRLRSLAMPKYPQQPH